MALLDIGAFTVFILLHLRLFSRSLPRLLSLYI